jgi:hypothetical protein
MSFWTTTLLTLLFLQTAEPQTELAKVDNTMEEVNKTSEELPHRLDLMKKGWNLNQAYSDVYKILSTENACSDFYGGPRPATTVLNAFVSQIQYEQVYREISFRMAGRLTLVRDNAAGVFYRLFGMTAVNTNGSFYQRRADPMRNIPADVGSFLPGSRPARALILFHELGHLIRGKNGAWLIPDDGYDSEKSKANTVRVEKMCRAQLSALSP